jgi:tetratricopeptide (TPR) repeat protein
MEAMAGRKDREDHAEHTPRTRRIMPGRLAGAEVPSAADPTDTETPTDGSPPTPSVQRASYPALAPVDPGHYELGAEVARGGMGRIRTAFDRRLGRDVAVKELLVDHPEVVRRFEREARITAQLQHPSIVSVHEAGYWPDGTPFYAMRLVAGRSLHEMIGECVTLADRLALLPSLLAVADAMAYAHARRVIHRDLKPSNVIVGEFGETVVIDWGLAKRVGDSEPALALALPAGAEQTVAGAVLGTPGYMAPEQAVGREVDERTDVFAIGTIIAHVLSGRAPLPDQSPPRLDTTEGMPPDLAAIVERATAADPARRYPSARELADDLRRFQTGQLVGAHRYSLRQLVWRWLRRHRAAFAVAAAATIVLAIVGTIFVVSIVRERKRVEAARALAVLRGNQAEDIMGFMLFDLAEQLRQVGRLDVMDKVARQAIAYYEQRGATDSPETLIVAHINIGDVLRDRGDLSAAREQYLRARKLAEERAEHDLAPGWRHRIANAYDQLGIVTSMQGDLSGALALHRKALEIGSALLAAEPTDERWLRAVAGSKKLIAGIFEDQGKIADARAAYEASLAIRAKVAESSTSRSVRRELMVGHSDLGLILQRQHEYDGAVRELRAALAIAERHTRAEPQVTLWQRDVALAHERLGDGLVQRGERDAALAEFRLAVEVSARLATQDPGNADWQRRLSVGHERVGSLLLERGELAGARAEITACRQIRIALSARDPTNSRWQRDLSVAHNKLGDVLLAEGDGPSALELYRAARAIRERLVTLEPSNQKWRGDLFAVRARIGKALIATGDVRGGIAELAAGLAIADDVVADDATEIDVRWIVEAREVLARARELTGDRAGARDAGAAALAAARRWAELAPADSIRRDAVARLTELVTHLGER